jgi:hypothetical protein
MEIITLSPNVYVIIGNDSLKLSKQMKKLGGKWKELNDKRIGWVFDKESYEKALKYIETLINLEIVSHVNGKYVFIENKHDGSDNDCSDYVNNSNLYSINTQNTQTSKNFVLSKNVLNKKIMNKLMSIQCDLSFSTFFEIWSDNHSHFMSKWENSSNNLILFYNCLDDQNKDKLLNFFNKV